MKLAFYHKNKGDEIHFSRSATPDIFEPEYDKIYGSVIFKYSLKKLALFQRNFPNAIIGGTGSDSQITVGDIIGCQSYEYENYEYSIYPDFQYSIGFTQRGCRLKCPFCVVPKKEGENICINSIYDIWRGNPYPRKIILLDNDFFGQPDWEIRCQEIIKGNFKVNFNQGINIRLINQKGAEYLSKIKYYDMQFKKRRIYTAWDNRKDEKRFLKGIDLLLNARILPHHIMVYMLCGYWKNETWDDIHYRFEKMSQMGLRPYPMVYDTNNRKLKRFQRWVVGRYYEIIPFDEYCNSTATKYHRKKQTANNLNLVYNDN
jgi:hypothetical protein